MAELCLLARIPAPFAWPSGNDDGRSKHMGHSSTISLIIPTLNEARNIEHVLSRIPASVTEVILVDGGSTDHTVQVAEQAWPGLRVLRQARRGKGNALATGIQAATGEYIVTIDADGSMDPAEIELFAMALDAGADYARGSRFTHGGGSADITWLRDLGNRMLNGLANLLFGTAHTDLCYGYNAMTQVAARALALPDAFDGTCGATWGDGFEIETLMHLRATKARLRVAEVPSFEAPRRFGESNLSAGRDGMRCLRTLVYERLTVTTIVQSGRPAGRRRMSLARELANEAE